MKIVFLPSGEVCAMQNDDLEPSTLGHVRMPRASYVDWNDSLQRYEARTPDGTLLAHGPTYAGVVAREVAILEARL